MVASAPSVWERRARRRAYAALCLGFAALALGFAGAKARWTGQPFELPVSDGRFYYAYLPTVVIDGDLDFSNQIREHWGPDFRPELLADRTPLGRVRNKYPIGTALTLAPAFLAGHAAAKLGGGRVPADGYSWPYQIACLLWLHLLAFATLRRADLLLAEALQVRGPAIAAGLLLLAVGTNYFHYATREPFMAHLAGAFWCAEFAAAAWRRRWWRWGFAFGMAIACRPTNAHLLPLGLGALASAARQGELCRALLRTWPGFLPLGLQMLVWKRLDGAWLSYSYGRESFAWGAPRLAETLLSGRHGLFVWSPLLAVACGGLLRGWRSPLVRAWAAGGLLLWYANSAWHCWWFGDSFGGRAFVELAGLFGIGLALAWEGLAGRPRFRAALFGAGLAWHATLFVLYAAHRIPHAGSLWDAAVFGGG